ncbi:hypothetical protein GCM10009129_23390 [Psychrobacter aestuarii]|uniref:Uncharacterized protein n=1 Tax=Psychrobacter aestuarii TaxID=556327 RepID=A0ABP3FUK0_9GAMM
MSYLYHTDKEFYQASLDSSARLIFDKASSQLSDGNPVHTEVKALLTLSNTALFHSLSNTVINTYYTILNDENSKNDDMEGWDK